MRSHSWKQNQVYFKLTTKTNDYDSLDGENCYNNIKQSFVNKDSVLILTNFNKEETQEYIKDYVLKLSKIFKFKYKFNNDDEIEINEIRSTFYMNTFLCIFRYLFENQSGDGSLNVLMIKTFVEDKRKLSLLYKFIDAFNNSKFTMKCINHCISYTDEPGKLKLKTTKDLEKYDKLTNKGYSPIHSFFKQQ